MNDGWMWPQQSVQYAQQPQMIPAQVPAMYVMQAPPGQQYVMVQPNYIVVPSGMHPPPPPQLAPLPLENYLQPHERHRQLQRQPRPAPDLSIVCRHFAEGKCNRRKCRFSHDVARAPGNPPSAELTTIDARHLTSPGPAGVVLTRYQTEQTASTLETK
jgi:hypothetical protein